MQAEEKTISCVFIGDAAVGKTRMVTTAAKKEQQPDEGEQRERMFLSYHTTMEVDGAPAQVELCDTQADMDHQEQRKRLCKMADLIFLCYSTVSPQSLEHVVQKWALEVRELNKPMILLGNKTDLRDNEEIVARLKAKGMQCVTRQQGQEAAEQVGALCFFELSCLEPDPLAAVFKEGLLLVFGPQKTKKRGKTNNCQLM